MFESEHNSLIGVRALKSPSFTLAVSVSVGYHVRRAPNKRFDFFIKSLDPCLIDNHDGSLKLRTVAPVVSPITMLFPPLKTSSRLTKGTEKEFAILCHHVFAKPSTLAAVATPVYPISALSATGVPAVGLYHVLLDHCSRSQDMMMMMMNIYFIKLIMSLYLPWIPWLLEGCSSRVHVLFGLIHGNRSPFE